MANDPPKHGERVGYIVLTSNGDGMWLPDWDGDLHTTIESGREQVRMADGETGEGLFAILVECRRVPHKPPPNTNYNTPPTGSELDSRARPVT